MRLSVLSVAYPFAPVREDCAGGAEHVLAALDRALVEAGERSLVVAADGSRVHGELRPVPLPAGPITPAVRAEVHRSTREVVAAALRENRVDVVHLHGVDFPEYLPAEGPPCLVTLHLPLDCYPAAALAPRRPGTWVQCVSRTQHAGCRSRALLEPIENGVDVPERPPARLASEHVLAIGRICPEKGFHHALDAASRADVPLVLAGRVYPYPDHERHFREEIEPRLDGRRRFVGPVGPAVKRVLLSRARCLVVASSVAETSSLVAMEALAAGVPVVALRAGALPEIVSHGRTGFLVGGVDELAAAIRRADELDPLECWREARERFRSERMTARHLARYGWLVRRARLEPVA